MFPGRTLFVNIDKLLFTVWFLYTEPCYKNQRQDYSRTKSNRLLDRTLVKFKLRLGHGTVQRIFTISFSFPENFVLSIIIPGKSNLPQLNTKRKSAIVCEFEQRKSLKLNKLMNQKKPNKTMHTDRLTQQNGRPPLVSFRFSNFACDIFRMNK